MFEAFYPVRDKSVQLLFSGNRFVYLEFPGRLTQYVVNNVSLAVEAFFILT